MKQLAPLWLAAVLPLLPGVLGYAAAAESKAVEPTSKAVGSYLDRGSTVRPAGFQQWQIQTLKELGEVQVQLDKEKTKRVEAEKKIERLELHKTRIEEKGQGVAQALAKAEKLIQDLETRLGTTQALLKDTQDQLAKSQKDGIAKGLRLKEKAGLANEFESKLLKEMCDHLKTKTKLAKLRIRVAEMELEKEEAAPAATTTAAPGPE